jgi:type I restriction enzyme S subunit
MSEWKETTLSDVVSILGDGLHGTPQYDNDGEYYFINGSNLSNGKIIIKENTKRTSVDEYNKYKKDLNDRTILISINGTLGNIAVYNNEKCILGKSVCYFNVINTVDKRFTRYVVLDKQFQNYINTYAHGTTIKNVSLDTIREYQFLLPPLPEQKAIASVLSSLDDKIDLLHRENKTLEAMAETLFRQWFVEEASDDWEEVPLGNSSLATIIKSGIHYFEGEKIYLETGDVDNTEIKGGKPVTYKNRPSRANMEPLPYSVWFAKKGGVRKLLMFDDYALNTNDLILSTGFTGLKTTKLSHYYLWCYLLSSEFQDIKDNFISGSVQPDINNESLLQIMVLKPENETLIKFNQIVENYFHKISINRKQISVLERLRDTLLPKLMSGEVRVTLTEEKA